MNVDVVQVPYDSGYRDRRMGSGPLRLVDGGVVDRLADRGHDVRLVPIETTADFPTEIALAFELAAAVRDAVRESSAQGRLPLILSGNCISAVGTVAALGTPDVYWLDAHGDLNTPDTTRSGSLDGMALSIILGRCWKGLAAEVGIRPVPEDRVWVIGARDLDPAEEEYLSGSAVHRVAADAVDTLPDGSDAGADAADIAYLHIDLDVLDPAVGTANAYAAAGGLDLDAVSTVIERLGRRNRIGAVAFTAYDPAADPDDAIVAAASQIAERVVASKEGEGR